MRLGFVAGAAFACFAVVLASPAPAAFVVSSGATSNVSCTGGVCTATAADAVLNQKDFRHRIGAGALVLVSGSAAQDIVIDAKIQWTKAHHLTLDAFRGIAFQLELVSESNGGVTLTTNDGGSGGALTFVNGKGKMTFWDISSSLAINGTSYTLANDIATLSADIAANPSGAYALGRGYDASIDGTYEAAPIATTLTGTFNGLGHAITNLTIDHTHQADSAMGFFAAIGSGGAASDVSLGAASVTSHGNRGYTGIFAGTNAGTIRNVSVAGSVTETNMGRYLAGLVGWNTGVIDQSRASGQVNGANYFADVAGLTAQNDGSISRSTSSADVTGNVMACGLVATNQGQVTLSSATGAATIGQNQISDTYAGGLVCANGGTVTQSFATGAVFAGTGKGHHSESRAFGGGLVADAGGTVQDCYSTGAVTASPPHFNLGGLVGEAVGAITTSYSTGAVMAATHQHEQSGGLIGQLDTDFATNSSTYWDLDTSGISDPSHGAGSLANAPGITGLTTAQFQSGLPAGFDPSVWAQSPSINNGYPYLIANPPL
jgi:hypothetical protein